MLLAVTTNRVVYNLLKLWRQSPQNIGIFTIFKDNFNALWIYIRSVCIAGGEVQRAEMFFIRRIRSLKFLIIFFAHILIGKTIHEVYCIDAIFPHVRREGHDWLYYLSWSTLQYGVKKSKINDVNPSQVCIYYYFNKSIWCLFYTISKIILNFFFLISSSFSLKKK